MKLLSQYCSDLKAATAIEYCLLAAGIALAISSVLFLFGADLVELFTNIGAAMDELNV